MGDNPAENSIENVLGLLPPVSHRFSLIQGAECRTGESEQEQLGDVVHIFRQPKDKFTGTCLSDTNLQYFFN